MHAFDQQDSEEDAKQKHAVEDGLRRADELQRKMALVNDAPLGTFVLAFGVFCLGLDDFTAPCNSLGMPLDARVGLSSTQRSSGVIIQGPSIRSRLHVKK